MFRELEELGRDCMRLGIEVDVAARRPDPSWEKGTPPRAKGMPVRAVTWVGRRLAAWASADGEGMVRRYAHAWGVTLPDSVAGRGPRGETVGAAERVWQSSFIRALVPRPIEERLREALQTGPAGAGEAAGAVPAKPAMAARVGEGPRRIVADASTRMQLEDWVRTERARGGPPKGSRAEDPDVSRTARHRRWRRVPGGDAVRTHARTIVLLLPVLALWAAGVAMAEDRGPRSPTTLGEGRSIRTVAFRTSDTPPRPEAPSPAATPEAVAYRPPLRGAPVGRISGGTRGTGEPETVLCVLTPDHTGLTSLEQPSLHWYLSEIPNHPLELTLIEEDGVAPLLETALPVPRQAGFQRIRLRDFGVRLEPNKVYRWYVAIVPDPDHRSQDQVAWGAIERVPVPAGLREALAGAEPAQVPGLYARAGLWYDALDAIWELEESAARPEPYRVQRAALLEQVGLSSVGSLDGR